MEDASDSQFGSLFGPQKPTSLTLTCGETTRHFISRILDPNDSISTQIKDLIIEDWTEELEKDDQSLCEILECLKSLHSFR
jgi:hypothetical protein